MKFIRYRENGVINSALVSASSEVYPLKTDNYESFYYYFKSKNLTINEFIRKEELSKINIPLEKLEIVIPILSEEVWAAGVTYEDSKKARIYEATDGKLDTITYYDKVYNAPRPEIFLKSTLRRTVGPNDHVNIRNDSNWQVPEPELGLVIGKNNDIIGYTLGNDMSCRDIEGENPLYLPQAKIWKSSCAIGPAILIPECIDDPYNIDLKCIIWRDNSIIFEGAANTSQLKRTFEELVKYLLFDNDILSGTILLTGTCIVPPNDFTLEEEDIIEISSSSIGTLRNVVKLNTENIILEGVI